MEILIAVVLVVIIAYFVLRSSKSDDEAVELNAPYKMDTPVAQPITEITQNSSDTSLTPESVKTEVVVQETASASQQVSLPESDPIKAELKVINGAKNTTKKQQESKDHSVPAKSKKSSTSKTARKPATITSGRKKKSDPKSDE